MHVREQIRSSLNFVLQKRTSVPALIQVRACVRACVQIRSCVDASVQKRSGVPASVQTRACILHISVSVYVHGQIGVSVHTRDYQTFVRQISVCKHARDICVRAWMLKC